MRQTVKALDLLHYWMGEKECRNRASIYRGPVLLTYDRRLDEMDPGEVPVLDAKGLKARWVENNDWLPTLVKMVFKGVDGRKMTLCDFASAGEGGSPYLSWLKVENVAKNSFTAENPLRSGRV